MPPKGLLPIDPMIIDASSGPAATSTERRVPGTVPYSSSDFGFL